MSKSISPETEKLVSCYKSIINNAVTNNVPCYVACVPNGMSPKDYMTGVLGLSDEIPTHVDIKDDIGKTDFTNYMQTLQDETVSTTKLTLFEPIFAFPEGSNDNVRTLRIIFDKPTENKENLPTFFDIGVD